MKKLMIWTTSGFVLALACGLAGLPHLSATLVTLTVFCAAPALVVAGLDALSCAGTDA
ncbi:hypothetical protein HFN49_04035 [Rhizobium leguminosarum]|uniref:hypothetical protein n=1 Tax=Rhizobium ruizarguesonis TaxID=2081791 RepID=UPI001A9964A9|nr:hypothetical protein [Rhizobium ruizarguesonis]MBY5885367.1 hypothetical protein [Rhizobium leguminosarum]QSZ00864.1 hypothetical protein J3P73_24135 [Rhizobium ruizarguesonis]